MKAVKAPCDCQLDSIDSFESLTLFNKVFIAWSCATVELFFLVLCSLAPCNLKRSLNVGLEAQVLANNTGNYVRYRVNDNDYKLVATIIVINKIDGEYVYGRAAKRNLFKAL